jgi:ABC-2 type transport system permease protein
MKFIDNAAGAFRAEIEEIRTNTYLLSFVSWVPLLCYSFLVAIFFSGVPRDLPVTVVDLDRSELSRMLLGNIDASSTLKITDQKESLQAASPQLRDGSSYAIIVVPSHFERDVRQGKQPGITVMLNTQFILMGKILSSALTSTLLESSGRIKFISALTEEQRPELARSAVAPIGMQITPFFNTYNNYFLFLISALLQALWHVFIVFSILISVGEMFKSSKQKEWLQSAGNSLVAAVFGKMLPYILINMFFGAGIVYFVYGVMPWPFAGSWAVLLSGMLLTILVYQFIALLFYAIKFEYASALSFAAVYTAPAFAAMGITFPFSNMGTVAVAWHDLLPISHYIHIQISQANYGAETAAVIGSFGVLGIFLLVTAPLVMWRYNVFLKEGHHESV